MTNRNIATEKWVSIIEADLEDADMAQRLVLRLQDYKPVLLDIIEHWRGAKKTKQSKADARDELATLHRSITEVEALLNGLGDAAYEALLSRSRLELLGSDYSYVTGRDDFYESPTTHLVDALQMYARIIGESAQRMTSSAKVSHQRDEIRDFAIRTVAVAFRREAPDVSLSQKPASLFHRVTEEFLGDIKIYDGNLRRSITRLVNEGHLKA